MPLQSDLVQQLKIEGIELRSDTSTRITYSTDASIYQIEPYGVAFPKDLNELERIIELCALSKTPVIARGSGSSLGGQAIGEALIIDCAQHLDMIESISPEECTATVQPGVILGDLNRAARQYGLMFGPDPASADRATIGGMLANNATGAHSIVYGLAADHLLSADVILSDGSIAKFSETSIGAAKQRARLTKNSLEGDLLRSSLSIRTSLTETIKTDWPKTWRRASGYNLNYLISWSPSHPPEWNRISDLPYPPVANNSLNLAPVMAGSEGTLGIFKRVTLNLVKRPKIRILSLIAYPTIVTACEAVPQLLESHPAAIELLPQSIVRHAGSIPAYSRKAASLQSHSGNKEPEAYLILEYAGDSIEELRKQVDNVKQECIVIEDPTAQDEIWEIRKVGLGLLASKPGNKRSTGFIEDLAVPVVNLGQFVDGMQDIMAEHKTRADFYAHASAGCLHIRPMINLKSTQGPHQLRSIAQEAVKLTLSLGGVPSGEHGDGIARSEWLPDTFGTRLLDAFHELKHTADPDGILNPHKILDPYPMDTHLRYGPQVRSTTWTPKLDFSRQGGLANAIEQCNGAAVCRKTNGVMCPSFQATREELYSTRGRANMLRALINGQTPLSELTASNQEALVYQALDLCLACKGCKAECPSGVDIAKLKYEFQNHYYQQNRRPLRDYLFAFLPKWAKLIAPAGGVANTITKSMVYKKFIAPGLRIAPGRKLPQFTKTNLIGSPRRPYTPDEPTNHQCLYLPDAFTEYFYPTVKYEILEIFHKLGIRLYILPVFGAGRTYLSKGFLDAARTQAKIVIEKISSLDKGRKLPIVGAEPSEILTLRDEYRDLLPNDIRTQSIAKRAWSIEEYLLRILYKDSELIKKHLIHDLQLPEIYLHGHCYQKAQKPAEDGIANGVGATKELLEYFGYNASIIQAGCCGMAGAFGYEEEHYDLSMQIGEMALFPAVREVVEKNSKAIVVASGFSCQTQIADGTGVQAVHPVHLIQRVMQMQQSEPKTSVN